MTDDLAYATIEELAPRIASGELSPVALTQAQLDRIEAHDGRLKSYATVMADSALAEAQQAADEIAAGNYRGPLHGIPIAVKDLCYTTGVRTMGGTKVLEDLVPDFDSTVVARFKDAGAVMLGKLNLTEGAMAGYNRARQVPVNPWDAGRWAGVSSSGSAVATAAGLCYASLGSDTGGSIRTPSAACGIVGLKPTWGRVSRYGVLDLAQSLDHVGPMCRSTWDCAVTLEVIAGDDPNDPTTLPEPAPAMLDGIDGGVAGMRIGYDERYATEDVIPPIAEAVAASVETLASLGAEIVWSNYPTSCLTWPIWRRSARLRLYTRISVTIRTGPATTATGSAPGWSWGRRSARPTTPTPASAAKNCAACWLGSSPTSTCWPVRPRARCRTG